MLVFLGYQISGRGVTVAYMLWEHAVRVQIPAPRQNLAKNTNAIYLFLNESASETKAKALLRKWGGKKNRDYHKRPMKCPIPDKTIGHNL